MASVERKSVSVIKHPWTLPQVAEAEELTRPIHRLPPGSLNKIAAKTVGKVELARRKNEYYEEAFSVRGDSNPLRTRIQCDSMVLVELKTNVIISDEFIFITELSAKLAERYQRPLSSVVVHVLHSQCILFAGTFEPAYMIKVSALAPFIQPATNRRNTFVLAEHLEEALGVQPTRGLVTFVPLPEDNFASGGKTIAHALEEAPDGGGSGMGVIQEERPASYGSRMKRLSVKSLGNIKAPGRADVLVGEMTPPTSPEESAAGEDKLIRVAKRRKSFVAGLFGRSTRREEEKQASDTS
ncbi:Tautomerase/MIF superfamily [Coniella lustricola]|uniref:L-dopachrome isomerase n=1 Tax=Coniella lustricola TaxID=2025994 RepID=A0A2T3AN42_9PEZI|nr:Tautomerase/MIF superfamily [Coniella lustricola]